MRLEVVKQYLRVDYDDDDAIIKLLLEAVNAEMCELIPEFDAEKPTARQQVLILASVKELYDDRAKRTEKPEYLRAAISSMLIKEMFK
nr:MAG TPA: hypothetical protein [Caudoviricetes sp.]